MIGERIKQYQITARLGAGGMGEVYLATDTRLGRQVALKFLPREFATDPDRRKRLELEARSASSLDHPNILTIYDIDECDGRPFIAMAYVEGATLKEKTAAGRLPQDEAIRYGIQIASGLAAAHARGIIHRDVKPDNVMIGTDDRARLADFGLARLKESSGLTERGSTVGTVGYMSPEQVQGLPVDARSDVFSLGIVLYELLTGRKPFAAEHAAAALYSIVHETPPAPREVNPQIPPEVSAVIEKAMAKEPDDRYPNAGALETDLRAVARSLEISRISSGGLPVLRPQRRFSIAWGILGGAVMLLGVAFLFASHLFTGGGQPAKAGENTLAVMYFENLSDPDDKERLGDIITELLTTDLSASQFIKVVSSQRIYDLLKHEGAASTRRVDRGIATEVARKAGASRMLSGTLSRLSGRTIITAQLVDVASGDVVGSERVDGSDVYAMVDDLSIRIKQKLGLSEQEALAGEVKVANVTTSSPEALREYLQGMDYYYTLDWPDAYKHFDRALALDSTFALAYLRKGIAYMSDGQRDKGFAMLATAGRYSDHLTGCDKLLVQAFAQDLAQGFNKLGALRTLKRATFECPTEKEPFFWIANLYLEERGQTDSALYYCRRALDLDPDYPFALLIKANALMEQKDYAGAKPVVAHYMSARANDWVPYSLMSDIYIREHKRDSAWYYARRAMQVAPDQRFGYIQIAGLFVLEGQPDSAVRWFEKMMSNDPTPVTRIIGLRQIAAVHKSWGRFGKSLDDYRLAEKIADSANLRPLKSGIQQSLGALYNDTERFQEAISHYHEAAALDSLNPDAPLAEAKIQSRLGNKDASQAITKVLGDRWKGRVDSTVMISSGFELRGFLALAAKDYQGAIENITAARRLSRDTTRCRIQIAEAYIGAGKYNEAIAELNSLREDAEAQWPSGQYLRCLYLLADAQVKVGRPKEAIEPLQRFLVFWGNADWDVPMVRDAKQLFGSLSAQ
ncbi:MAG: protein kinase [candidate division Zixibacteria bacterium]|nr:protein kinase [candidate division Zixibacteria bacterium]